MAMKKLKVNWPTYHRLINKLGRSVKQSRFKPDCIVAISRGGLLVGRMLSEYFNKPLGVITVQSYRGTRQDRLRLDQRISSLFPIRGKILLVDDLVDSGKTLEITKGYLEKKGKVKTAVMYRKECTTCEPDYYGANALGNVWIIFPYSKEG